MTSFRLTLAAAAVSAALLAQNVHASGDPSLDAVVDPHLSGNTSYDGWAEFSTTHYPGYPSFGNTAAWPSPIGSNQNADGTFNVAAPGDAVLSKVSGGATPLTSSLYFSGFDTAADTLGGTVAVTDATPVAGIKLVSLQVQIGAAFGFDFYKNPSTAAFAYPTLSYNGGTQALAATPAIESQFQDGTFTDPTTGLDQPVFITTYGFTWDLSGMADPIASLNAQWSEAEHSQLYSLRLDQASAVPEPASLGVLAVGSALLMRRRRAA